MGRGRATRGFLAAVLAGLLLPLPMGAQEAQAPDDGVWEEIAEASVVGFDAVVLRPLAAVQLFIGAVLFVPAAVPSYFSEPDALQRAKEIFIDVPAQNLLDRPLGDL